MKINPKTEAELQAEEKERQENLLWPKGIYDFMVVESSNFISKAGNEMIKIKLKLWNDQGKEKIVFDYLTTLFEFKLRHFCEATCLLRNYEDGNLEPEDCLNKSGQLNLYIKIDKTGNYTSQNAIEDYVIDKTKRSSTAPQKDDMFLDSDVPDFGAPPLPNDVDIKM